ncbi:hypothetical protein [Pasteurella bettyae]
MIKLDKSMLALTKNAYFYKSKGNVNHSEILNYASKNCQEGKNFIVNIVEEELEFNGKSYTYSLRIFPSQRDVYFINNPDIKEFIDIIHAYAAGDFSTRGEYLSCLSF